MLYRSATEAIAKLAMLGLTIAAARLLPAVAFAMFSLATTLGWLCSVAGDFGLHAHIARAVAQQPERAASLIARWRNFRVLFAVVSVVTALFLLPAAGIRRDQMVPVGIITVAYAVLGGCEFFYHALRGLGRTDVESTITVLQRVSLALCGLAVLWLRPSLMGLSIAMLIPAVLSLIAVHTATRRLAPRVMASGAEWRISPWREFHTSVAPIGVGILLAAVYFRVDVFLLERWTGPAAVAHYNAVYRIVDALRLFPAAVLAVVLPRLCRARNTRDVVQVGSRLTAAAVGVSVVLFAAAPVLVPTLFGDAFSDAVPVFRVLLLAFPIMTLNYALTQQLIAWHGHRFFAYACAGALVCNVTVNWFFIPTRGASGAAWATVWTEGVLLTACLLALTRVSATMASVRRFEVPLAYPQEAHR
jgi:O-antigen/teichoic acid export membrane protein